MFPELARQHIPVLLFELFASEPVREWPLTVAFCCGSLTILSRPGDCFCFFRAPCGFAIVKKHPLNDKSYGESCEAEAKGFDSPCTQEAPQPLALLRASAFGFEQEVLQPIT